MHISTSNSLNPVTKELTKEELLHLLRRCLFGVSIKEVDHFSGKNIAQCMDILLQTSAAPKPLVQDDPDIIDPLVKRGDTWVNAPYENEEIDKKRRYYLRAWWLGQMINRDHSLTEKMTFFWHNHFVTEMDIVKDGRYSYQYVNMLRAHALGNFKKLIREGTTNPAMLVYLNGNSNNKAAPNENYSRELFELFTLGKDPQVKYTEADVKAAARALTGWSDDKENIQSRFHPELHDEGNKEFSPFFNDKVISGKTGAEGAGEKDELIDMIFERKEASKFFCRNLYRWFVCAHIDKDIEDKIISPLSEILIANNYEVAPVIRTLLSSEHFFDPAFRGCIVKSPLDFWIGAGRQFELAFPQDSVKNHLCWIHYNFYLGGLSLTIGDPPSVAGWPAFYQAPKFHRWWLNSYTLSFRSQIIDTFLAADGLNCNGPRLKFDFSIFVRQLEKPEDPDHLINSCLALVFPVSIELSDKARLKSILLSGQQSNHYWTDAWNKFISNPEDATFIGIIETRLNAFFREIINMPEYQIM